MRAAQFKQRGVQRAHILRKIIAHMRGYLAQLFAFARRIVYRQIVFALHLRDARRRIHALLEKLRDLIVNFIDLLAIIR